MASEREPSRRPRSVVAVAVGLIVTGGLSALAGVAASAASSCCGSPDPADPTPALAGLVAAAGVSAAAIGLWRGRMRRGALLLVSAALPVAVVAAAPSSSDLAALVPVVLLGWLALWWYLRRPVAAGWLRRGRGA
jgi:hypothetical protein